MWIQDIQEANYRSKEIKDARFIYLFRQPLFAHSVCANFGLIVHSVCANFDLNAHSMCKFWLKYT